MEWCALAVIARSTAAALEAQRRRKEEEARQAAEAAQEAARKNAAFEAERVQNYLQGKAMLDAVLKNSSLSKAEKERVRAESQAKGIGAALGVLGGLMQAAQLNDDVAKSGKIGASLGAAEEYIKQKANEKRVQDNSNAVAIQKGPNWIGIIIGGVLVVVGTAMTFIGLGFGAELEPGGFFMAGAGVLLAAIGTEIVTQSLGSLRPSWWPAHILNVIAI